MPEALILVHGGAGRVPEGRRSRHREGCLAAARRGGEVLAAGGSAVEAVCAAVETLENDGVFNAGTGCALTRGGQVSLDVALMDGATREIGGLCALPAFRNPIRLAERLLRQREVLLVGEEAARWAEAEGFECLDDDDLITPHSRERWRRVVQEGESSNWAGGTVGAVARDAAGRLAAGTSTGGPMGKRPGRVGDSPLAGAGTYADRSCAVSATGDGEAFVRGLFAARMAFDALHGEDLAVRMQRLLSEFRSTFGGVGGGIALSRESGPVAVRNTPTMSHAWWSAGGEGCSD